MVYVSPPMGGAAAPVPPGVEGCEGAGEARESIEADVEAVGRLCEEEEEDAWAGQKGAERSSG